MTRYGDVKHVFRSWSNRNKDIRCIAGSAAVDVYKASDIDIWCDGVQSDEVNSVYNVDRENIYPKRLGWIAKERMDNKLRIPRQYINMVYPEWSCMELIRSFDLSCCMRGILPNGEIIEAPEFTLPCEPIVWYPCFNVEDVSEYLEHSLRRINKLCDRYETTLCDVSADVLMRLRLVHG